MIAIRRKKEGLQQRFIQMKMRKGSMRLPKSGYPVRFIHLPEIGGRVVIEVRGRGRITVRGHGSGLNVWGLITIRVRVRDRDKDQG